VESLSCFYNKKVIISAKCLLKGRGPYQGLLVLHPLNERNINANIKKLGMAFLSGKIYFILKKTFVALHT
jgi:hypothetical protein